LVPANQPVPRHRHIEPWLANHACYVRRVLNKLERIRRQAKRAFLRDRGWDAFGAERQRWQAWLRFVRSDLLSAMGKRPLFGSRRAIRKALLEECLETFRAELPAAGIEVPPERELRDLVKRALRSGRRYIRYYGRQTVRENPDLLQERLWNFVADLVCSSCPFFRTLQKPIVMRMFTRQGNGQIEVQASQQARTSFTD
jgi:hypothetical protein